MVIFLFVSNRINLKFANSFFEKNSLKKSWLVRNVLGICRSRSRGAAAIQERGTIKRRKRLISRSAQHQVS